MGRSHILPIQQPDDNTCGPASLKQALAIFGKRYSLDALMKLCKTNRNGTSTKHIIDALNKLGFSVLVVEYATLRHLQSALKYKSNQIRAVMVTYLYDLDKNDDPHPESGHWAVVSAYLASKSRIVLLDSASGQKKSYNWQDFRTRWMDYDLKRTRSNKDGKQFKLIRRWQQQLLMVVAKHPNDLPKFTIPTRRLFPSTE